MTDTGSMDTLLRVDENTSTTSDQLADGSQPPTWIERAQMWCRVEQKPGQEMVQDAAEQWQAPLTVTMRYDSRVVGMTTLPTDWRIHNADGSVVYDVISAMDLGLKGVWIEVLCLRGSPVPLT